MKLKSLSRKSISAIPKEYSGQERRFAQSVSESLDALAGRRGPLLDRAVTFRDLVETNVLALVNPIVTTGDPIDLVNPIDGDGDGLAELPTQPYDLVATGGFGVIFLEWQLPPYIGHAYVEIYRYPTDDFAAATAAGVYDRYYGDTYQYADGNIGSQETWYYWVRAVNVDGVAGPFNSEVGTSATSAIDYIFISDLIDEILNDDLNALGLNQTITALSDFVGFFEGYTGDSLITRIGDVETSISTGLVSSAQFQAEVTARTDGDSALSQSLQTLTTTVGNNTTSIQTNVSSIDGIEGKFSVKIDNNGHVSGFGLISTANDFNGGTSSSFIVAADRFGIAAPFNASSADDTAVGTNFPFKVFTTPTTVNGVSIPAGVYIDDAFIHNAQLTNAMIANATITSAKILDLSATKITSGNIQIDAANDIKIYQGKTSFTDNSTGFWLGLNNNAGSFHVGSSSTNYLKFDGNTGDLTTSGLRILAEDQTVLFDAGGVRSPRGINLVYNGDFRKGREGWTDFVNISPVFFSATQGICYAGVTSNAERAIQDQYIDISPNETLYLYTDAEGSAIAGMGVLWFREGTPPVYLSANSFSGTGVNPPNSDDDQAFDSRRMIRVREVTAPSDATKAMVIVETVLGNSSPTSTLSSSLLTISGTSAQYTQRTVNISSFAGKLVRPVFKYVNTGGGFGADIQLDDIQLEGTTFGFETDEGFQTSAADNETQFSNVTWASVTESTTAGRWNRITGSTPSSNTGGLGANSGSYSVYAESSSPANASNYVTWLRGPVVALGNNPTFTFYEGREGADIGTLYVYLEEVEAAVRFYEVGLSRTPPVINPSYAATYIRDLSVDTFQINDEAVTLPEASSAYYGSSIGYTEVELTSAATRITFSWSDVRDRPSKIILAASMQAFGDTSQRVGVRGTIKDQNNSQLADATQSHRESDGGQTVVLGTVDLSSYSSSITLKLYCRVLLGASGTGGSRIIGNWTLNAWAAKK